MELKIYNIKTVKNKTDITIKEIEKDINKSDLIVVLNGSVSFSDIKITIKTLEKNNFEIIYIHRFIIENNTTIGAKNKKG